MNNLNLENTLNSLDFVTYQSFREQVVMKDFVCRLEAVIG